MNSVLVKAPFRVSAVLFSLFVLGGCVSPPPPPGAENITISRINSPIVTLWKVRWKSQGKAPALSGEVLRHYPAAGEDTTRSHLSITLFAARGAPLRVLQAEFEPRQIPPSLRSTGYSTFTVPLTDLPGGTTRIEIRVYEDPPPP